VAEGCLLSSVPSLRVPVIATEGKEAMEGEKGMDEQDCYCWP